MTLQLPLSQQNFRPLLLKSILVPLNFTISIFYKSCYDKVKCKKCAYKIQVWVIISITHLYEGRTYSTLQNTYTVCNVTKKGAKVHNILQYGNRLSERNHELKKYLCQTFHTYIPYFRE